MHLLVFKKLAHHLPLPGGRISCVLFGKEDRELISREPGGTAPLKFYAQRCLKAARTLACAGSSLWLLIKACSRTTAEDPVCSRWWRNWSEAWPWKTAETCSRSLSTMDTSIKPSRAGPSWRMCWQSLKSKFLLPEVPADWRKEEKECLNFYSIFIFSACLNPPHFTCAYLISHLSAACYPWPWIELLSQIGFTHPRPSTPSFSPSPVPIISGFSDFSQIFTCH